MTDVQNTPQPYANVGNTGGDKQGTGSTPNVSAPKPQPSQQGSQHPSAPAPTPTKQPSQSQDKSQNQQGSQPPPKEQGSGSQPPQNEQGAGDEQQVEHDAGKETEETKHIGENGPPQPGSRKPEEEAKQAPPPKKDEGHVEPQEEEGGAARGEGHAEGEGGKKADTEPEGGYPEQLHAGKVEGVGPEYGKQQQLTMGERFQGLKEQIKGVIKRDPALKQQGIERKTGELKKKQREQDSDPFANAADDKKDKKDGDDKPASGDKTQPSAESSAPDVPDKDPSKQNEAGMSEQPASHPTEKGSEEQAASVKPEGDNQRSQPERDAKSNAESAQVGSS